MIRTIIDKGLKPDFDAQVMAELMIKSNALIPMKLATRLCGLSRLEIERRIIRGLFPKPRVFQRRNGIPRKAFYLQDLHEWIKNPHMYVQKDTRKLH
ncbi:MAG: hypothetical protein KC449_13635 [Anaerolineales bacterium]|nr:hypothetical protein [Anaerolineales bacterium]